MNRNETTTEELERQQRAVADLRLEQGSDEETQRAVIEEAARRATRDSWPEMPEEEREREVEAVVGFEGLTYQWSIFKRGWYTGPSTGRIPVDPETAGPRILVRAYATAEADTRRMRSQATGRPTEAHHCPAWKIGSAATCPPSSKKTAKSPPRASCTTLCRDTPGTTQWSVCPKPRERATRLR